jgi:hypothetical protein
VGVARTPDLGTTSPSIPREGVREAHRRGEEGRLKKGGSWVGRSGGKTVRGTKATTKQSSVKKTAAVAKKAKKPTSVRIHKANGRIQEERTYPRSADPKKSRG